MNALKTHKKYQREQEDREWEQRRKEEEEKLSKMTEEERQQYYRERNERLNKVFAPMMAVNSVLSSTPYSNM